MKLREHRRMLMRMVFIMRVVKTRPPIPFTLTHPPSFLRWDACWTLCYTFVMSICSSACLSLVAPSSQCWRFWARDSVLHLFMPPFRCKLNLQRGWEHWVAIKSFELSCSRTPDPNDQKWWWLRWRWAFVLNVTRTTPTRLKHTPKISAVNSLEGKIATHCV